MSLASRISAFFLAALALVLVGFSITLYFLARNRLHAELDSQLFGAIETLSVAAEIEPDRVEWRPALRPPAFALPGAAPILWAVVDDRGRIVDKVESSANTPFLPEIGVHQLRVVRPISLSRTDGSGKRWRLAIRRLQPVRLTEGELRPDPESEEPFHLREEPPPTVHRALTLVAAAPLARMEASLVAIGWSLAGLTFLLWLLAVGGGRKLSRRALLPVSQMATAARGMSVDDLGQRLPGPGTRDELDDLASSFNGLLTRLHEALERRKRFAGDASHQLRTPLAAILGQIEVARRRDRTNEEYRQVLDQVHSEGRRLQRIVEALLFLSRAESDAALPDLERVELAQWLNDHLEGWSIHPRAIDLTSEIAIDTATCAEVHPPLLAQLLDNLLENAFKYSDSGSPVCVRLNREPGGVSLTVEDRGVGLTPEEIPQVFEPFFRSPRARLRASSGIGLGLSVAKRITEAFGGRLVAENRAGKGSRFTVHLPEIPPKTLLPSSVHSAARRIV